MSAPASRAVTAGQSSVTNERPTNERPVDGLPTDGRRARRARGRLAATEAMVDLVLEGNIPPTAEEVAERAGVSVASLFRYFETLDDLRQATSAYYFERYAHLFEVTDYGLGPLPRRITNFVASRLSLYETVEPVARLTRFRAHELAAVDRTLHRVRIERTEQVRHHFSAELIGLTPAPADDLVISIATLTSFEAWDQTRNTHGRSQRQIQRAWTTALTRLLTP